MRGNYYTWRELSCENTGELSFQSGCKPVVPHNAWYATCAACPPVYSRLCGLNVTPTVYFLIEIMLLYHKLWFLRISLSNVFACSSYQIQPTSCDAHRWWGQQSSSCVLLMAILSMLLQIFCLFHSSTSTSNTMIHRNHLGNANGSLCQLIPLFCWLL